jgi:hypothetical protein
MTFNEFKETLLEYEIEGGFGSTIEKGLEVYYVPDNQELFRKRVKHRNKRKAYNQLVKKQDV